MNESAQQNIQILMNSGVMGMLIDGDQVLSTYEQQLTMAKYVLSERRQGMPSLFAKIKQALLELDQWDDVQLQQALGQVLLAYQASHFFLPADLYPHLQGDNPEAWPIMWRRFVSDLQLD